MGREKKVKMGREAGEIIRGSKVINKEDGSSKLTSRQTQQTKLRRGKNLERRGRKSKQGEGESGKRQLWGRRGSFTCSRPRASETRASLKVAHQGWNARGATRRAREGPAKRLALRLREKPRVRSCLRRNDGE